MFQFLVIPELYTNNCCGGVGTAELAVLSLEGLALFNISIARDQFTGLWDKNGKWTKNNYSQSQLRILFNSAYRLNPKLQFAISVPYVINSSNIPGLKQNGSGIGDVTIGGRFEIFHEFQPKKSGKKLLQDKTLPYLALTFGLNLPTGKSDESAENEVDITGKGFYFTTLGFSLTKTIVRNRFQIIADANWQHSLEKKYSEYYGKPITYEYRKQAGERFNYSFTANYIFSLKHSFSISASGFLQGNYKLNGKKIENSNERNTNFILSYTYYPSEPFRITSSVKLGLPENNFGVNAKGSTAFNINFTYYIPQ